jgi:hypothetical protein
LSIFIGTASPGSAWLAALVRDFFIALSEMMLPYGVIESQFTM